MFISTAYAQGVGGGGSDILGMLFPLVMIMAIFWFLLIRPQRKRMAEHQALLTGLRRGDAVVTNGGIMGKVSKIVDDNEVVLEVSENVKMRFMKSSISEVRSKTEPVKDSGKSK
ncbi:MAG: preprotein translocase subunit YajC [Aestuariivirgaceae bacterium]